MSYCPKCGRQILDERMGCPICSVRENVDYSKTVIGEENEEIKTETVEEFTVEDKNGTSQRFENDRTMNNGENRQARPVEEKELHPVVKILVIAAMIMIGTFGGFIGILVALALKKSPYESYRKFGKTLMRFSIVYLIVSLVLGAVLFIIGGVFNVMTHHGVTLMHH